MLAGLGAQPAWSCSRHFPGGYEELFRTYDEVFLARVDKLERFPEGNADKIDASYTLLETFRGRPPAHGVVSTIHAHNMVDSCQSYLLADSPVGETVVFFTQKGRINGKAVRFLGFDSTKATDDEKFEQFLTRLRSYKKDRR